MANRFLRARELVLALAIAVAVIVNPRWASGLRGSKSVFAIGTTEALSASTPSAQEQSPLARVEALGLEVMTVGRVVTYFDPADRERAMQLAGLTDGAAAFFGRELNLSLDIRLAALAPAHWFAEVEAGPYTIPWCSIRERLVVSPARGERLPGGTGFSRATDFIALHEYGHLAAKHYFHPDSAREYGPVHWFEELLATYFGYAYIRSFDPKWAETARSEWAANVKGYTPRELSLDWQFMRKLPPDEMGRTYGWYQNLLNLRVADVHDQRGLTFLKALKERLPWDRLSDWSTASLLPLLEGFAPGFEEWAGRLQRPPRAPLR